jgi:hypothetical protein
MANDDDYGKSWSYRVLSQIRCGLNLTCQSLVSAIFHRVDWR